MEAPPPEIAGGFPHHASPMRSFVPPTPLKLNGMEVLSDLNGRDITALSIDDRIRLWDTHLSFNLIPKTAHKDMKYVMFARLNQGSVSLNPQELRNCLYRGAYNRLIAELSESRDFLRLWGKSEADKRMKDRERVLTFFALTNRRDRYRTPFRNFLNDEMEENQDIQAADATRFSREFQNALKWVERVFTTQQCFRRFEIGNAEHPPGRWIQRRMDLIHDVELVGFGVFGDMLDLIYDSISEADKRTFLNMLRNRLVSVMTSPSFKEAFQSGGTRQPRNQQTRLEMWLKSLDTAILNYEQIIKDGHRLEDLINRLPDCAACSYQVTWDDAVIRNRRVIHRYCNFAVAL